MQMKKFRALQFVLCAAAVSLSACEEKQEATSSLNDTSVAEETPEFEYPFEFDRFPSKSLIEEFSSPFAATDLANAREITALATELIVEFEGFSATPYNDPAGYCTVGIGHLIEKSLCQDLDLSAYADPLAYEDALALLEQDTRVARAAVEQLVVVELNDDQFSALSSFVFNLGRGNFGSSTLLKKVNVSDHDGAAAQFPRWVYANEEILPGLVARRNCERALYEGVLTTNGAQAFNRSGCESLAATDPDIALIDVNDGER